MTTRPTYIGRREYNVTDVSAEYRTLAESDEKVGQLLIGQGQYRHGIYFLVQAMEKYVRSTIFGLVNPNTDYFRQRTLTHNLDDLLAFLREIICSNAELREQVRLQMQDHVLGGIKFGALHNDLRYPNFDERRSSYFVLQTERKDADTVYARLQTLKQFLKDIHQLHN
jgi:HEPN domain-containing protein